MRSAIQYARLRSRKIATAEAYQIYPNGATLVPAVFGEVVNWAAAF
jgi:hypothetical protein